MLTSQKAMAVEDWELTSSGAPACKRAESAPSGCRSRRASGRNRAPPLGFCWAGIRRDLSQGRDAIRRDGCEAAREAERTGVGSASADLLKG